MDSGRCFGVYEHLAPPKMIETYEDLPEDLKQFITKEGLGGDNPKRKKVKL